MKLYPVLIIIFVLTQVIYAEEEHSIDWVTGRVYSHLTISVPNDHNAASNRMIQMERAREQAKVNYYRVLRLLNVEEGLSLLDYFDRDGYKSRELYSLIDNAKLYRIEYPDINSIRFTYYINLYGPDSIMNILMGGRESFTESLQSYMGFNYSTDYTGVIIDARGTLRSFNNYEVVVRPSLFIAVRDSNDRLVFNQYNVLPDVIRNTGMVGYSYDILADHTNRVGNRPLRIVATGVGDRQGAVIVISERDAKLMLSSDSTKEAIRNGRVVIIID